MQAEEKACGSQGREEAEGTVCTEAQRQEGSWDSPRAPGGPGRGLGRQSAEASGQAHGQDTPVTLQHAWPGVWAAPAPPVKPQGGPPAGRGPEHPTGSLSIHLSGSWELRYLGVDTGREAPLPLPAQGSVEEGPERKVWGAWFLGSSDVLPALPGGPSHLSNPLPTSKLLLDTQETQANSSIPFFPRPAPCWSCRRAGRKEAVGLASPLAWAQPGL